MGDKDRDRSRLQSVIAACPDSLNVKLQAGLDQTFREICSWWYISYPPTPAPGEEGWVYPKLCQEIRYSPIPIAKIWALYAGHRAPALTGSLWHATISHLPCKEPEAVGT